MKNSPSGTKKIPLRIIGLIIVGYIYFLSKLGIGTDTIISAIALLVFIGAIGYYLFPKSQGRRRKPAKLKYKQYDDSQLTDYMMEKIMKAYNVKEEPDDSGEETSDEDELYEEAESEFDEELGEEVFEEADEYTESPTSYNSRNEKAKNDYQPILYNGQDDSEEEKTGLKTLIAPVQLPITISIFWLFAILAIYKFFPEVSYSFSKFISPSILVVLPVLFLFGLSGFLGMLLKQSSESLETTSKEKASYILNVSKMFIGWGLSIYVFITNIFN